MTSLYCTDSVFSGETAVYYDTEVNSESSFHEMLQLSGKGVYSFDPKKSGYYYLNRDLFRNCLESDLNDGRFSTITLSNFIFSLKSKSGVASEGVIATKETLSPTYSKGFSKSYQVMFIAEQPKESTPKRCYISGQISGIEDIAESIFESAEEVVKKLGFIPVNPMKLEHNHARDWESYMREDIIELMKCDSIYVIRNWRNSKGATIEVNLSKDVGINIIFQK